MVGEFIMNWMGKFLIFLLVVIVAVSLGLTVYYLMRNSETIELSDSIVNVNAGETFKVSIEHKDAHNGTTVALTTTDEELLELVSNNENEYTFRALKGGIATIILSTNNRQYDGTTCTVNIGDGSTENPYFVRNYEDLSYIGNPPESMTGSYSLGANYKQIADIDLSVKNANRWQPIGAGSGEFTGTYDGNGYTIYNLKITTPSDDATEGYPENITNIANAGLFSVIGTGGVVRNVILDTVTIDETEATAAGSIAGINKGTIQYCTVRNANITSNATNIGGIVGTNNGTETGSPARLDRVSFVGTLSGAHNIGGITSNNIAGTIINSYSRGTFNPTDSSAKMGGIAYSTTSVSLSSDSYKKSYVINCYSTMQVSEINDSPISNSMAMIVYSNTNPNGTSILTDTQGENRIYGNYYYSSQGFAGIYGQADNNDKYFVTAVTMEQLKSVPTDEQVNEIANMNEKSTEFAYITYSGDRTPVRWDFASVWKISSTENDGLPTLRAVLASSPDGGVAVPDRIYDVEQNVNGEIWTETDLRYLADGTWDLDGDYILMADITLTGEWQPIGTKDNPFTGTFNVSNNGETNYKIYNLRISGDYTYAGLFGYVSSTAEIVGVEIVGVNITSGTYIGGIAGYSEGIIDSCSVTKSTGGYVGITRTANAESYIGGIVGYNKGTVSNSNNSLDIATTTNGFNIYVGGITGVNDNTINSSGFTGTIAGTNGTGGTYNAGGIAGVNTNRIANSVVRANVNLPNSNDNIAGGIAGLVSGNAKVTMSSFAGDISAYVAGGLVGKLSAATSAVVAVERSYAGSGTITGSRVGGLAGQMTVGEIANSYTLMNLSGSIMAGMSTTIEKNGGNYATVRNCFVAVRFDTSSGRAYYETESEVRLYHADVWDYLLSSPNDNDKVAGFVVNCVIDRDVCGNATRREPAKWLWVTYGSSDDGLFSTDDCKKTSTFTNRGFNTSYWACDGENYPTLIGVA